MTARECCDNAQRIALDLRRAGHGADADMLVAAIEEGTTATEVMMIVRHALRQITANTHVPARLRPEMTRLIASIDNALT